MTQGLTLGITVGSSRTVAATAGADPAETAVHIRRHRFGAAPELSENLLSRVGDPVDILLADGSSVAAADLVAETIGQVVADFDPISAVATVPAWWSAHVVEAQRQALDRAGSGAVALVAEPLAAVRRLEANTALAEDTPVVVYDMGATGTTVSVVGSGTHSGLLGEPIRSTELSGAEFDLLTMRYVLANALGETDFDPFDPVVERELSVLRNRCAEAKHRLSRNTATMVEVRVAGAVRDVRLVRDELEELFRAPLADSVDLVYEAVRRAGLGIDEVGRILLTGGGAAIGLVTETMSGAFAIPIAPVDDPATFSARGAALLAADLDAEAGATDALALAPASAPEAAEPETVALAAVTPADRATIAPPPSDPLPQNGSGRWRRLAFIGGAVVAVGAIATGTLALGTAGGPSNSTPAPAAATSVVQAGSPTSAVAPAGAADSAARTTDAAGHPVAATNSPGTNQAQPAGAQSQPGTAAAPNSAAPNSPAPNSPAPNSPAPASAAAPNAPAPDTPAQNSPAPNPPPNSPAPQPQAPQQPSQPTLPSAPSGGTTPGGSLGNTLNNGLGQAGNTLGTVLQAPGKVLPHEGN